MAESQLAVMEEEHVNEKIPESKPEFYYSEEQRAALEQLVRNGDGAFKMRLKEDNIKDFLSAREVNALLKSFQEWDTDSDSEATVQERTKGSSSADSGVHSTYWPQMSDTEVPALDIGWSGSSGLYKGVTRVHVYTHPPKEPGPHIKQVVRKLIQEAHKVVAIVMDLVTDLQILQDLLDASSRRSVAVYIVLDETGVPHFLDMCSRLQINAVHLRNLRVRQLRGSGLALSFGRLPGSLSSKYMLVDGEKAMFGSYSFTWSSSRMDRNVITVMSGQVVDFFDQDFRELYAISEQVDLYREFNITKPPIATHVKTSKVEQIRPIPVSTSRFQVSMGDTKHMDLKVPAHKYHNPKYSLVFGNANGLTRSLQDFSGPKVSVISTSTQSNGLHVNKDTKVEKRESQSPVSNTDTDDDDPKTNLKKNHSMKQLMSIRNLLKGKNNAHNAHNAAETIDEGVVTQHSPTQNGKVLMVDAESGVVANETEDGFEILEKPGLLKNRIKKTPKMGHSRSVSMQALNASPEEGFKNRRRSQKKACIQQ